MLSRVATFVQSNYLMNADMAVQAKLADVQSQESSGFKSETFSGISGDAVQALNIQSQVSRLTADNANANTAVNYLQTAYSTVGDISSLATTIKSQLATMLSGTASATDASSRQQQAANWLNDLAAMLNTTSGGSYVFSGQATDVAPVNLSASAYNPTASPTTPDTGYYQGATTGLTFVSSDGRTVGLGATADDPAFETLLRAVELISANPTSNTSLQQAYDLVGQSISGLGVMQESLSARTNSLNDMVSANTSKIDTLNKINTDLTGADLSQAAVLVSQYQTQIEAIYSTIAKLSTMSLTKYLS